MALLRRRNLLAAGVRAFFSARGYTEVETPYAVHAPGEEVHLRARPAGDKWLNTSPEFAMKKLAGGRLRADLPAGPGVAGGTVVGHACAGVHHAGMV